MHAPAHDEPHQQPWRWYGVVLAQRYARFWGRARRAEYWWFSLFSALVSCVPWLLAMACSWSAGAPGDFVGGQHGALAAIFIVLYDLYTFGVFIPTLAVAVRRLHDIDRSGWWLLLYFVPLAGPIIMLVWLCSAGTPGPNRFGADPCSAAGDAD